jgi:asparagine synthetase B (glutamine-hydrolysing)
MESASPYNPFCVSSYLTFRYVVKPGIAWKDNVIPKFPTVENSSRIGVQDPEEILEALRCVLDRLCSGRRVGLLLSGGIDSGILAALMPAGSPAYTIRFEAEKSVDETDMARVYASHNDLEHHVVSVSWSDYEAYMDRLMMEKMSPLHPVEVAVFKAVLQARQDGANFVIVGIGADSNFGGLDKLLSEDWSLDAFQQRYTFVDPSLVVRQPVSMKDVFEVYLGDDGKMNVQAFLNAVHGPGIIQAFENAVRTAGGTLGTPYECLCLRAPLDLSRIRSGESKYLLRAIFRKLYPWLEIPEKIAFARPMDVWMRDWKGPKRSEFLPNLDMSKFTGEQKWLMYCLERFMDLFDTQLDLEPLTAGTRQSMRY